MMAEPMSLKRAREIAQALAVARKKHGAQLASPYPAYEILEALAVLEENGNWDAPTREELTKANRQLAAAEARAAKCAKKRPELFQEDDQSRIGDEE